MEAKDIQRQIELIEKGLNGVWAFEGGVQYVWFIKPPVIGGWGKLLLSNKEDFSEMQQQLEFEVIFVNGNENIAFINVMVNTSGQKIQYRLVIDYLNSYIGNMYLIDSTGLYLYFRRLVPRTALDD